MTTGSRHPTLAFVPAHVIDDAFATLANVHEDPNDNSSNQGSSSDTCDLLGDIPVPLTVLQSQEVQFGNSPGVEVLSLIWTHAGTLRMLVTNEQGETDGLAVKVEVVGMQGSMLTMVMLCQPKPKARAGVEGGNS